MTAPSRPFPLLILHGLFGSGRNWKGVESRLAGRGTVYSLDARNHGDAFRSDTMSYPEMAEDVVRFLARRGIPAADVIGHSMGGKTAMELALAHGRMVGRLVVVDIAPRAYAEGRDGILEAMLRIRPEEFRDREAIGRALSRDVPEARLRQFLLTNVRRDGEGVLHWNVNLEAIRRSRDQLLAGLEGGRSFNGRALFILGGESDAVAEADRGEILRLFPGATFVTIPGAGHWVHADRPGEFLSAVEGFLNS